MAVNHNSPTQPLVSVWRSVFIYLCWLRVPNFISNFLVNTRTKMYEVSRGGIFSEDDFKKNKIRNLHYNLVEGEKSEDYVNYPASIYSVQKYFITWNNPFNPILYSSNKPRWLKRKQRIHPFAQIWPMKYWDLGLTLQLFANCCN